MKRPPLTEEEEEAGVCTTCFLSPKGKEVRRERSAEGKRTDWKEQDSNWQNKHVFGFTIRAREPPLCGSEAFEATVDRLYVGGLRKGFGEPRIAAHHWNLPFILYEHDFQYMYCT